MGSISVGKDEQQPKQFPEDESGRGDDRSQIRRQDGGRESDLIPTALPLPGEFLAGPENLEEAGVALGE